MTRWLRLINRILPALVVALVVLMGVRQIIGRLSLSSEIAPLAVAEVALPVIETHAAPLPDRNLFAANGLAWVLANETAVAAASGGGKVMGVVDLPGGPRGVMVDQHFVAIGEALGGGRLTDLRDGHYVIESDGVEQVRPLDPGRKGRAESLLKKRERE